MQPLSASSAANETRSFASRMGVAGPTFAIGASLLGFLALCGMDKAGWSLFMTALVWGSCLTGPFAGLWATSTWRPVDAIGWAIGLALAIAAHPLRRGWLAGTISALGVVLWLLFGVGLTFDGV